MFEILLNLFTTVVIGMLIFVQIMRADVKSMLNQHDNNQKSYSDHDTTNYKIKSMEHDFNKLYLVSCILISALLVVSVTGYVVYYIN